MRRNRFAVFTLAAAAFAGTSRAAEDAAWVVSYAEGAVESRPADAAATLLETGADLAGGDRIALGFGAKLAVVAVEGASAGRVVTVRGPAEGTLAELLLAATDSAVAPADAARAILAATTEGLGVAEVTRGAGSSLLQPVYPQGQVAAPCGEFVFVSELEDLDGGSFEVRLYDADPSRGGAKPVAKAVADGPQVDAAASLGDLALSRKYWWQVAVRSREGEDVVAGDPVAFTLVKPPAGTEAPPKGFETPEERASWHLLRAKRMLQASLHLDAYREYLALVAAGGGSAKVEKECRNLEKKIGLGDAGVRLLADAAGRTDAGADELVMRDGRKLQGRLVSQDAEAVVFQATGTRYRVAASDVAEVRRGAGTVLPSAAPFVTVTSKRYTVQTNAGKEFGKEAARHLEALYDTFVRTFGDALGAHNAKNLKARIYRDDKDFAAFLAKEHPDQTQGQGFYFTGDSTLYLFRSSAEGKETTFQTLYHEGAHQLLYMLCNQEPSTVSLPHYWVSESLPCYLEGLEWRGSALVLERPPEPRVANFVRLSREGKLMPLADFLRLPQSRYGSADLYDQGTALFWHMMRRNGGKDAAKFLGFVKSALSSRDRDAPEEKAFKRPLAEAGEGYAEWYLSTFGTGGTATEK